MRDVLVDAGPLIALFDRADRHHEWAADQARTLLGRFATVWPAITEASQVLASRGIPSPQGLFMALIDLKVEVALLGRHDFISLGYLMDQYRDLPMDLADAALVHVYARDRFRWVFTIDRRDFSIYRVSKKPLNLIVPGD